MSEATIPKLGVVIVDKPVGMTSHDVVNQMRKVFRTRRVGHAGTLDPAASGVLVVAFGPATRFLEYVVDDEKAYEANIRMGMRTDTLDLDGTLLEEKDASHVTEAQFIKALGKFTGSFLQVPPMYSAIKVDGKPLHKAARRGEEILREPRPVNVRRFDLLKFQSPDAITAVECSKGTYVRSLAESIGDELECGACLAALRRTRSGRFTLEDAVPLNELTPAHGRDMRFFLSHMQEATVNGKGAEHFGNGQVSRITDLQDGMVRVHREDGVFIGVAEVRDGSLRPRKVLKPT